MVIVEDVLILFCERLGEHIHLGHLTILVGAGSPEEIYQPVEVKGVLMVDLSCVLENGVLLQIVFTEIERKQAGLDRAVSFFALSLYSFDLLLWILYSVLSHGISICTIILNALFTRNTLA